MMRRFWSVVGIVAVLLSSVVPSSPPAAAAGSGNLRVQLVDCANIADEYYAIDDCEPLDAPLGTTLTGAQELLLDDAYRDNARAYVLENIPAGRYVYPGGTDNQFACGDAVSQSNEIALNVDDGAMTWLTIVQNMPTGNPPMDCAKPGTSSTSAAIHIRAVACPKGVDPKTSPGECTDPVTLGDDVSLTPWRAGGDGMPYYRVNRYSTGQPGEYRIGYANARLKSYALAGLDRSDYANWHVDGLTRQDPTTSWTVDVEPWGTTEVTIYYHDPAATRRRRTANTNLERVVLPTALPTRAPTEQPAQEAPAATGGVQVMLMRCPELVPAGDRNSATCGWIQDDGRGQMQPVANDGASWNLADQPYLRGYHIIDNVPAGQYVISGLESSNGWAVEATGVDALLDNGSVAITVNPGEYTYVYIAYIVPEDDEPQSVDTTPYTVIEIHLYTCADASLSDCVPIDDDGSMWIQSVLNPNSGSPITAYPAGTGVYTITTDPGQYQIGGFESSSGKQVTVHGDVTRLDGGVIQFTSGPGGRIIIEFYYHP